MTSHTTPHQPAATAPDLEAVVGRWRTDGQVLGAEPLPVTGSDIYELLDGGHSLVHHVDDLVGGRQARAIKITGERAPESADLSARSYDNTGAVEILRLQIACGSGGSEAARTSPRRPPHSTRPRLADPCGPPCGSARTGRQ